MYNWVLKFQLQSTSVNFFHLQPNHINSLRVSVTFLYSKTGGKHTQIRAIKWPRPTIQAANSIREMGVWGWGETNSRQNIGAHFYYPGLVGMHMGTPHVSVLLLLCKPEQRKAFGKETTGLLTWDNKNAFQCLQYPTASTGFVLSHITSRFQFTKIMAYLGKKTRGLTCAILFVAEKYGQDCRCIFFHFTLGTIFYL